MISNYFKIKQKGITQISNYAILLYFNYVTVLQCNAKVEIKHNLVFETIVGTLFSILTGVGFERYICTNFSMQFVVTQTNVVE